MTDQPEHLDLTSHNLPADKTAELLRLFPEIRTEGDKIDFDKLKLVLGQTVDVGRERYGMNWPGKAECFKTIQTPSMGTLLPAPAESVDFDTTENLIIEGDNLEALKLLQKAYLGKVKMIYIDPPYNTGNDFIYPDNYTESLQTYLEYTGQVDAEGKKFGTNTEDNGRFHSLWMNMMYPRLYLARNLLRDDGLILVSIDDNEVIRLRGLMDEVFGEENFVAQLVWQKKTGAGARSKGYIVLHEYVLCYSKHMDLNWDLTAPMTDKTKSMYTKKDEHFSKLGPYATWPLDTTSMDERANLRFPIIHEGHEIWPRKQWLWSRERVENAQKENKLVFNFNEKEGTWSVRFKGYLYEEDGTEKLGKPTTLLLGTYTQEGTKNFEEYFHRDIFPFPKPVSFIKQLLSVQITSDSVSTQEEEIFLDFFAGSGTTAEAILGMNQDDGGHRKFILVQLPEPTENKDFPTIADITKERVRRVIKKLNDEEAGQLPMGEKQDRGFRVFKLAESNFKAWQASAPKDGKTLEKQLELHIDHIREERTSDDILYEILLKSGFPLTTPVTTITLPSPTLGEGSGVRVYSVASGGMLICLEKDLTLEAVRAMAEMKPQRVVCLDLGFAGNDQLKTNAVQIFKNKEIVFKTV
jgi:adenine-specific DNA-methyltransferase